MAKLIREHSTLDLLSLRGNHISPAGLTVLKDAVRAVYQASAGRSVLDSIDVRDNPDLDEAHIRELDTAIHRGMRMTKIPTAVKRQFRRRQRFIVPVHKHTSRSIQPPVGGILTTPFGATLLVAPATLYGDSGNCVDAVNGVLVGEDGKLDTSTVPGAPQRRTLSNLRQRLSGAIKLSLAQVTPAGRDALPPLPENHEYVGCMAIELRPPTLVYRTKRQAVLSLYHGLSTGSVGHSGLRVLHYRNESHSARAFSGI